jgi:predicted secreted protein
MCPMDMCPDGSSRSKIDCSCPKLATAVAKVYTEANDGQAISANVGDVITFKFSENPTTGYTMIVDDSVINGVFTYTSSYAQDQPGKCCGYGGKKTITLKAVKKGSGVFRLVNARSWEYKGVWKDEDSKWSYPITI